MIEIRLGKKYANAFHKKHPNTILVESGLFTSGSTMNEIAKWTKENFQSDALMGLKKPKNKSIQKLYITWHCVSEIDAMAAKMRWN